MGGRRWWVAAWAAVTAAGLVGCVEPPEARDTAQVASEAGEPVCGGACDAVVYDACTCGADDPCGWRADGVCDEDRCEAALGAEVKAFDDGDDCDVDCALTVCLTGAINQNSGSNRGLAWLCEQDTVPGLVPDCDTSPCLSTFDSFLKDPAKVVYPALFDALDTNGDGWVNDADQRCTVNLVGFSWGGVNAVEVARQLINDPRVAASRSWVENLILLDPYQPLAADDMAVPRRVKHARTFRHSVAPSGGCSRWSPGGPYKGLPPLCPPGADCLDYDFSLAPRVSFPSPVGAMLGREVDHCDVPWVAFGPALAALIGHPYQGPLPPTVPVKAP